MKMNARLYRRLSVFINLLDYEGWKRKQAKKGVCLVGHEWEKGVVLAS